jgi:hypothetical protein
MCNASDKNQTHSIMGCGCFLAPFCKPDGLLSHTPYKFHT